MAAGARVVLELAKAQQGPKSGPDLLRGIYSSNRGITLAEDVIRHPARNLVAGTYWAELAGAPFVENGLKQECHERLSSRVYGIWKELGHEG